jgi:hypothetical protein
MAALEPRAYPQLLPALTLPEIQREVLAEVLLGLPGATRQIRGTLAGWPAELLLPRLGLGLC